MAVTPGAVPDRPPRSRPFRGRTPRDGALLVFGLLAAVAVRIPLLPLKSVEYERTLSHWYAFIVANGHFEALRYEFSDYSPVYLYLVAAISYLAPGLYELFAVKAVSIVFEFPMAFFVGKCVGLRYPHSQTVPIMAGLSTLLLPGVVANGALLGQTDAIYTAPLLACLYFLLVKRPGPAFAALGLAFSMKLQTVFLLPLFWWISRKEKMEWRFAALVPLVYLGTLLPAWFLGRPFLELALFYVGRLDFWRTLSAGAPNPYAWLSNELFSNEGYALWPLFVLLLFAAFAALGIAVRRSRATLDPDLLVTLAVFSAFATPYLLPSMHERYFYPAAVLSVVLAFYRPRLAALPLLLGLVSIGDLTESLIEGSRIVVSRAGAVALLVLLVFFLRRLLRDLGYRAPWREAGGFVARQVRTKAAAAAPLLLLGGCLAFALFSGQVGGRFGRPAAGDSASVRTLARVTNLSAEHQFVPFTRKVLDASGAVAFERDRRLPSVSDTLFRGVTVLFGEDHRPAQLHVARVTAAALFCLAALLAYLALVRLSGRRWVALGATLLAFSSFSGGSWDLVAAEGAPALLAVFLAFHGAAVFVREGTLPRFLAQCALALTLSFAALFVLAPFLALGFASDRRRGDSPASDAPVRPGLPAALRSPSLAAAGFCLLFGGAWAGLHAAREAALPGGERGGEEGIVSGASSPGIPGEERAGLAWRSGAAFFPYALGGADFGGSTRSGRSLAALAALLGFAASVVGAWFSNHRRLLWPLALSSLPSLFPVVPGFEVPGFETPAPLGASLVFFALLLSALRRFGKGAAAFAVPVAVPVVAAAGVFALSAHRAGEAAPDPATAALEARTAADFAAIRRTLRLRLEEPLVFAPGDLFGDRPGAAAEAAWRLAGNTLLSSDGQRRRRLTVGGATTYRGASTIVVEREEQRRLAEFVIERGRRPGRGLLTPGNEEFFLYHRAALDGEVSALIEAAGEPVADGRFDLFLHEGRLLYVREPCRPGDTDGMFILHLDPVDRGALPPLRRQYGFDNRSFRFHHRALERGERCVARVPLPDYAFRRLVTGHHSGLPGDDFAWQTEFVPLR